MRRSRPAWAALMLATTALLATTLPADAAPATATRTACPTGWGSQAKRHTASTTTPVKNIRTGRHACYDRMVVDIPGAAKGSLGYSVRYVDHLYQDGSGRLIPVGGGAVLEVRVTAPAYDPATGKPTYPARAGHPLPGIDLKGYRTFRDTRFAGSFEGDTQLGLGVRARLPFRVLRVTGHVIVDVAHNWSGAKVT
ncbi:AMIN-like domain-containing (lipo)protein [Streptomyces sp. CA-249302]|uniref:AMIN-like domain-containing (lipo)protein n=1 Tax=Streptomyces sp. CA-249302 TaxID=3240058 RepID=UPI003D8A8CA5